MATNVNLWTVDHGQGKVTGEPHEGQKNIMSSDARFKVVVCGRRWGKSFFAVVTLLTEALNNPGGLYWYIGPTYRQAKNIAWRMLLSRIKLFPKYFQDKCHIEKNNLIVELPNGSIIELKGAQDHDSLVGSGLNGVVLDEYAMDIYGNSPVWKEAIRPALSDKMGWAIFISTPRGYNHFYDLYDYACHHEDEGWQAWKMPTETNPYIAKQELEAARREVGSDMYSQEYEADFRKRSGLVYKEFERDKHVIEPMNPGDVPSRWRLEVGLDFGTSHPTAAIFVLFDHVNDIAYVVDEHYESEWTTERHLQSIIAKENKWITNLRKKIPKRVGDSQAKQVLLDYAKAGYPVTPTPKGRDSVMAGISEVRKRLIKDIVINKPKLFVCNNCENTIREFENYSWQGYRDDAIEVDERMRLATKGQDAPKKVFDDAMDALRYVIQYHSVEDTQGVIRHPRVARNPITGF
jgi:hypothetical protein